jgi:small subunit ribosomal protein S1
MSALADSGGQNVTPPDPPHPTRPEERTEPTQAPAETKPVAGAAGTPAMPEPEPDRIAHPAAPPPAPTPAAAEPSERAQPTAPSPPDAEPSRPDIGENPPETLAPTDQTPSPSAEEIDREVAQAMEEMSPDDLAELSGGPLPDKEIEVGPDESVAPGTELTGTVAGVSDDEVFLEFGVKMQGIVPRNHFGKKERIETGRRVDVVVERFDQEAGLLVVARKGVTQRATWLTLKPDMIVEGRITGMNKGGLEMDLHGIRAFMPASHVDIAQLKDISVFLNQHVRAVVMEVDRRNRNVLVSRRKMLEKELAESREKLREELQVGQVRKGIVGHITEFGAFVDLGGIDGLVHIRDISWAQVENVSDFLKPGQEVEVQILRIDRKRDRISLGIKQTQPNPWDEVPEKYPAGSELKVRIVRLADFGAFAELEPGVEGLIPLSEMSWTRIHRPSEVVSVGDMVDAAVIRVDLARHRIALSMKQATEDPWAGVLESFPKKSLVTGKVTRLTDFGAFVELAPGVEGLIHISEMSDRRIRSCREVVEAGQEVQSRVLGVDKENRRISLSIKAVAEVSREEMKPDTAPETAKLKKKRKKKLRGGLASHWDWLGNLKLDSEDVDEGA